MRGSQQGEAAGHLRAYEEIEPLLAGLRYRERVLEVSFSLPGAETEQVGRCLYQARHLCSPAATLWRQALGRAHPIEGPAVRLQRAPQQAVREAFDSLDADCLRDPTGPAQSKATPGRPARTALFGQLSVLRGAVIDALLRGWGLVSGLGGNDELAGLDPKEEASAGLLDALWREATGRQDASPLVPCPPELADLVAAAVREAAGG